MRVDGVSYEACLTFRTAWSGLMRRLPGAARPANLFTAGEIL